MKHFRFRLQAVLEQRERRETQAKQTYAEAQAALTRAERLLVEMREVRQALLDELCRRRVEAASGGTFDAFETKMYQDYMQIIAQSLQEQESDVKALATDCEVRKLHLIGTSQDRQALATVYDKHRAAHAQAVLRAEQAVMDEMATTRFSHQQRG